RPVDNDQSARIQTRDRPHLSRMRRRSRSRDTALKFKKLYAHRSPAFAQGNLRSMSAPFANPLLRLTSGNSARHKTCLRLSFQLPSTPVQIQAVASRVLAAPESSCATRDEAVPNGVIARGWQADASRTPGPQFCTGTA